MRKAALAVLTTVVVGCSGSPPGHAGAEVGASAGPSPRTVEAIERAGETEGAADSPESDPLLGQARAQIRQGRVSAAMQAKLAASTHPDHRHAARLLQEVAGVTPAPILSRAGEGGERVDPVGPVPTPAPEPTPELGAEPAPEPAIAVEEPQPKPGPDLADTGPAEPQPASDPPREEVEAPELDDFAPGTPVYAWLSGAPNQPAPKPVLAEGQSPLPDFRGERSILLRERAPEQRAAPSTGPTRYPDVARLVILTSLSLAQTPDKTRAELEFAGAGAVDIDVLPIDDYHLRLSVIGAGAVPGFLDARPAVEGLEVMAVERHGQIIDVELEHAPGWAIVEVQTLTNGALVSLVRGEEGGEP